MKVSRENDNNFGYEKIIISVDNIPLSQHQMLKKKGYVTNVLVGKKKHFLTHHIFVPVTSQDMDQ